MTSDESLTSAEADASLATAVEHHKAGRLDEAARIYGAVLQAKPGHVKASHNLGAIHLQRKDPAQALPLLAAALAGDPDGPQSWITYGHGLIMAGQFEAAEALVTARGSSAPAAMALEIRLRQAWAIALTEARELERARGQLERVWEMAPDDADANADLGLVLLQLDRAEAAETHLARALRIAPSHLPALVNRGSALKALDRVEAAEASYRQALTLSPGHGAALRSLGVLLAEAQRHAEALAMADEALAAQPTHLDALMTRGAALTGLSRFDEALESYDRAARLSDEQHEALMSGAILRLLLGRWSEGWRNFEARWRTRAFLAQSNGTVSPELLARLELGGGEDGLVGKRVLLLSEQGVGDMIMFASMIPEVSAAAAKVTCVCDRRLVGLLSSSFPDVDFLDPAAARVAPDAFDKAVAMGSLGALYRNRREDFPGRAYLRPRAEVRQRWVERLGRRPAGLRIGVSWRGGLASTGQRRRSLTLDQLGPILDLPGCEFVSVQYGDPRPEIEAFNAGRERPVRVFPPAEIDDFEELSGLLHGLDAVVSVQTAVVHLAGANGVDCLAMAPCPPEWRYGVEGSAMPWYDSVRIFRQPEAGDWPAVIAEVAANLQGRLLAGRGL